MKIQVLPSSLADKIAAGEVVERPASVVKELVENSLDAGAQNISIEIRRGGITFIRVTDDGSGMEPADAKVAFLRHATSKISEVEDLSRIVTYGFRGEALAAIAAVSKVDLITCTDSQKPAYFLSLEGGEVAQEDEVGAAVGTTVIVRDLFYNTPARLHFMKKDATEAAAVTTMVQRIALGRHDVSFTLISDQKVVFRTSKSDDMKNTIYSMFGETVTDHLLSLSFNYKNCKLEGYVCESSVMRANRNMQYIYLNDRFIKSRLIYNAIDDAYRSSSETGKYPICFLKITVDPKDFDVNVHPTKLDVKFRDESSISILIKYGIVDALESVYPMYSPSNPSFPVYQNEIRNPTPELRKTKEEKMEQYDPQYYEGKRTRYASATITVEGSDDENGQPQPYNMNVKVPTDRFKASFEKSRPGAAFNESCSMEFERKTFTIGSMFGPKRPVIPHDLVVIGELFKLYILIEYCNTFYIVDKHAAHEKLIYNNLVNELKEKQNIPVQMLLSPVVVVLTPTELDFALHNAPAIYELGFDFHESGQDRISLMSVPTILPAKSYAEAFVDVIEMLQNHQNETLTQRQERTLKMIACRSAIKGGVACSISELLPLVAKMINEKDMSFCPHGRPILQEFSRHDLDKMFKRIK